MPATFHQPVTYPMDRMYLRYGYKDRDSVQVRLDDKNEIYMSIDGVGRATGISGGLRALKVPLGLFVKSFDEILDLLERKKKEADLP